MRIFSSLIRQFKYKFEAQTLHKYPLSSRDYFSATRIFRNNFATETLFLIYDINIEIIDKTLWSHGGIIASRCIIWAIDNSVIIRHKQFCYTSHFTRYKFRFFLETIFYYSRDVIIRQIIRAILRFITCRNFQLYIITEFIFPKYLLLYF